VIKGVGVVGFVSYLNTAGVVAGYGLAPPPGFEAGGCTSAFPVGWELPFTIPGHGVGSFLAA
jgi:hypothetical protein